MKNERYDIPDYLNETVIFSKGGSFHAIDCESFHAECFDNIFYSTDSYEDCRRYVLNLESASLNMFNDRKIGILFTPLVRILLKVFKGKVPHYELKQSYDGHLHSEEIENVANTKIHYMGWMNAFQKLRVGDHPVFEFTKFPALGYQFNRQVLKKPKQVRIKNIRNIISTIIRYSRLFRGAEVSWGDILRFWLTRDISGQNATLTPGVDTIALYPSFLLMCPNHKWILEIEDMLTMMYPFVSNGSSNPGLCKAHPVVKMIGTMISQKECGAIICHLESTANGLKKLFSDYNGAQEKIIHIPLGMPLPKEVKRTRKSDTECIKILFMSGWSQSTQASYRRGLLNTLAICKELKARSVNFKLTIRSSIPKLLPDLFEVTEYEEVTILSEKISDKQLKKLYASHDILLFPAPRLAVTTLLTAMANNMAIVAGDGFGVEEYVHHEKNGLVAHGYKGESGWIDEEGVFRENYTCALRVNTEVCTNAVKHIQALIENPDYLLEYQTKARDYVAEYYDIDSWNKVFVEKMKNLL